MEVKFRFVKVCGSEVSTKPEAGGRPQVKHLQLASCLNFENKDNNRNRVSSWTLSPVDLQDNGNSRNKEG